MKSLLSREVRFAVREALDEAGRHPIAVRLDVPNILWQLSSKRSKRQINNVLAWNGRWIAMLTERNRRTAVETYDFIESELPEAIFVLDQFDVIATRADEIVHGDGHILDFGVHTGGSTRALARIFPDREIHGFDSFEGLPEDWAHIPKGGFGDVGGALPKVPGNVQLHKGWFDQTLPGWVEQHPGVVSLMRVDCDLYSSTKTVLSELRDQIRPGTWIVFDELIGYRGWRDHEYRAFVEFIDQTGLSYTYVAYGLTYVLVRVC